jgi:hypothetical protein
LMSEFDTSPVFIKLSSSIRGKNYWEIQG